MMTGSPPPAAPSAGSSQHVVIPFVLLLLCVALYLVAPLSIFAGIALLAVFFFAFRRPAVWLAIAFAGGVLPQSLLGEGSSVLISFSDVMTLLMVIILGLYLASRRVRPYLGPLKVPLLLFLCVNLLASVSHWRGSEAIVSLARIVEYVFCTTLVFATFLRTPQSMERAFVWLMAVEAFLGVAALVGFAGGATKGLYILNMHKNALGPSLGCGVVVSLVYFRSADIAARYKSWILAVLVLTIVGLVFSLSRGAWAATIVACLVVMALRRDLRGINLGFFLAIPLFVLCWHFLPQDSAQYAGDVSLTAHTMQIRYDHQASALELFRQSPWFGTGVGLRKENDPENVYVLSLAETGVVGLCSFLFLLGAFYALVLRLAARLTPRALGSSVMGRIVLCSAGIFTVTVVHGAADVYWRRGVVFVAWASAGLCLALWRYLQEQSAAKSRAETFPARGLPRRAA